MTVLPNANTDVVNLLIFENDTKGEFILNNNLTKANIRKQQPFFFTKYFDVNQNSFRQYMLLDDNGSRKAWFIDPTLKTWTAILFDNLLDPSPNCLKSGSHLGYK